MPRRRINFIPGEIYHLYNRSVANEQIFDNVNVSVAKERINHYRYFPSLRYFRFQYLTEELKVKYVENFYKDPLVEIYSYSLMPNHSHLLVKELKETGIRIFMHNFQSSFAKYYNIKNRRYGSVFQNRFKAKLVETVEQFIHIARYIHLNPVTAYIFEFEKLENSPVTSYKDYIKNNIKTFVTEDKLMREFSSKEKFIEFHRNQVDYQRKLAKIKNLTFE